MSLDNVQNCKHWLKCPLALVLVILPFHPAVLTTCSSPAVLSSGKQRHLWDVPPTQRHTQITDALCVKHQLQVPCLLLLPSGILSLLPSRLGYVAVITDYWHVPMTRLKYPVSKNCILFTTFPLLCPQAPNTALGLQHLLSNYLSHEWLEGFKSSKGDISVQLRRPHNATGSGNDPLPAPPTNQYIWHSWDSLDSCYLLCSGDQQQWHFL